MASNASPYSPHSSAATGAEPQRSPGSDVVAVPPPEPNEPVFAPVDELTRARRLAALRAAAPDALWLTDREQITPYECDGLAAYRKLPLAVVLPADEDQVCRILRACHEHKVPVVPRGAGTGLSGGAMPITDGIVLSLAKFKRILEVDPYARTATVQPGVRNLAVSEAAAPYGLYYAPDPSSQVACTIGGNVSENSGGVH